MKVKTSELIGPALDWAVENALLLDRVGNPEQRSAIATRNMRVRGESCSYCLNWAQGGPIIEREGIQINFMRFDSPPYWTAHAEDLINKMRVGAWAPTPLIAAMRCFVSSKLGDEVDVPEELA